LGTVELPIGTGLGTSKQTATQLETALNAIENVEDVFWTIGGGVRGEPHKIDMYVAITPKKERNMSQFAIMDEVRETLRETAPEADEVSISEIAWVTGTISGGAEIDLILNGPDLAIINEYAEALIAKMQQTGAFENLATSSEEGRPEAQLIIDRRKAADQAVSARAIANISRITLGGFDAGSYEENGDRFDIRLRLKADQRQSLDNVGRIQVRNQSGKLVDFASISEMRFSTGLLEIQRQNRSRKVSVISDTASDIALGDATITLEGLLEDMPPPPGVSYQIGGYADIMRDTAVNMGMALLMAVVVLYMVLASQFNSFVQPPIIMVTAPLSFSGAFAAIYYFGFEMSIFVQIGLIGLMGIVMKNGILLVDRANQLIEEGLSGRDAIARACPERLRPVLMTAISAIFGMIPVALATSDGSEFRAPVGALIIGGLTTSTLLTLIVVPAAFMVPRDIRKCGMWIKSTILAKLRKA
jgi:HAE1 family hydrophobic/amphiphilic exporter-1